MEPPITLEAKWMGGAQTSVDRVVIHCTDPSSLDYPEASAAGQAAGTARYFASGSDGRKASAHYVHDEAGEAHCVPDDRIAYHAPPNARSIGQELAGRAHYTRQQWLDCGVLPGAAARTRDLCERHGVPIVRIGAQQLVDGARGICGHADVSAAWGQTTHTDPGAGFPWDVYLQLVEDDDMDDATRQQLDRIEAMVREQHGWIRATTQRVRLIYTERWQGGDLGWLDDRLRAAADRIVKALKPGG